MKDKIKNELLKRVGNTWYDKFIYVFKIVVIVLSIAFTLEYFMGRNALVNSYPAFLWLLSGIVPVIYMFDTFKRSVSLKSVSDFNVTNISGFILFGIITFIEIVIFRLYGFSIDVYYLQILLFMMFTFIFVEIVSFIIMNICRLCPKMGKVIEILLIPLFCFSGILFFFNEVHNRYLKMFLRVNPISYLVEGFRDSLIYKKWFLYAPHKFAYFMIICLLLLLVGFVLNRIGKKK